MAQAAEVSPEASRPVRLNRFFSSITESAGFVKDVASGAGQIVLDVASGASHAVAEIAALAASGLGFERRLRRDAGLRQSHSRSDLQLECQEDFQDALANAEIKRVLNRSCSNSSIDSNESSQSLWMKGESRPTPYSHSAGFELRRADPDDNAMKVFVPIISAMELHPKDVSVQCTALRAVNSYISHGDLTSELFRRAARRAGALEAALFTLNDLRMRHNFETVTLALSVIRSLCQPDSKEVDLTALEQALDECIFDSLVAVIEEHIEKEQACHEATALVGVLCSGDDVDAGKRKLIAVQAGILPSLLLAMKQWPDSLEIQQHACLAVAVLCSGHAIDSEPDPDTSRDMVSLGFIEPIVRALKRFEDEDPRFSQLGSAALRHLVHGNKSAKHQARRLGARRFL